MTTEYLDITYSQLALAALLIIVNFGISIAFRLGLTQSLIIASLRMVVQLLLIGLVLEWLFSQQNPWMIVAISLVMEGVAGQFAVGRTKRRFAGI